MLRLRLLGEPCCGWIRAATKLANSHGVRSREEIAEYPVLTAKTSSTMKLQRLSLVASHRASCSTRRYRENPLRCMIAQSHWHAFVLDSWHTQGQQQRHFPAQIRMSIAECSGVYQSTNNFIRCRCARQAMALCAGYSTTVAACPIDQVRQFPAEKVIPYLRQNITY